MTRKLLYIFLILICLEVVKREVEPNTYIFKEPLLEQRYDTLNINASCYYPEVKQTDNTPHITANNSNINKKHPLKHKWVAVSRDLLNKVKFGDTVEIIGTWVYDGKWIVQDVMNKRFKRKIDFLIGKHDYANNFNDIKIIIKTWK